MKRALLFFCCFQLNGMEESKHKSELDLSKIVITVYLTEKSKTPMLTLAPMINEKIRESQERCDIRKIEAIKQLKELSERIKTSPDYKKEISDAKHDPLMFDAITEIVAETIEEYIIESEISRKNLEEEKEVISKELSQKKLLAYIGAGTAICTSILGVIATILASTL